MILFEGKILPDEELDNVLDKLWDSCMTAIENRVDIAEQVIRACGKISEKVKNGEYDTILQPLLAKGTFTQQQMEEAVSFFDEGNLRLKYEVELGVLQKSVNEHNAVKESEVSGVKGTWGKLPDGEQQTYTQLRMVPLGILFHIAAGNAEGLPFYSVLEGMLAGNVNVLKLPSMDDGLSVMLLHEIIQEEPELAPYVCVLDVPSTNLKVMKQLADMADGIVVWGGDEAVQAVRTMADPATQIISWGHKLSFAYVTPEIFENTENETYRAELYGLARHICVTRQLLCNSCQGIFVDTDREEVVLAAAERFLAILEEVNKEFPEEAIGIRGKVSLSLYNEELEAVNTGHKIMRGKGVSVIVSQDKELALSYMFKNCWVKPLHRQNIVRALKSKRGHLQTVGLICSDTERKELADMLAKTGITRIAHGGDMSHTAPGGAHDGEYPLRRYCKVVEVEL